MKKLFILAAALVMAFSLDLAPAQARSGDHPHLDGGSRYYGNSHYRGGHRSYRHRRRGSGLSFYYYAPRYSYPRRRTYRSRPARNSCSYWSRRCTANWGYGNNDYRGCMRYYGCR
ncbi:hypothetical protein ACKTEK_07880 [Tepidamorphus sp. 3E244]|uniref:hypothetical protein n=1 Tax=Tepidamorphus sp. 3E244 TaxID=3385498 RepID=UPI0038FD3B2C